MCFFSGLVCIFLFETMHCWYVLLHIILMSRKPTVFSWQLQRKIPATPSETWKLRLLKSPPLAKSHLLRFRNDYIKVYVACLYTYTNIYIYMHTYDIRVYIYTYIIIYQYPYMYIHNKIIYIYHHRSISILCSCYPAKESWVKSLPSFLREFEAWMGRCTLWSVAVRRPGKPADELVGIYWDCPVIPKDVLDMFE